MRLVHSLTIGEDQIVLHQDARGCGVRRTTSVSSPNVRPIVKWAGGKQWLAVAAPVLTPPGWAGRYYEPFLGGGAFFFALEPGRATLSDRNQDLIDMYRSIAADPEGVIRVLTDYPYDRDFYYAIRARIPRSAIRRTARFLYLNRCCWNGLYRVNRDGQFNTPFGDFENPTICDSDRLRSAAVLLQRARLVAHDFAKVVRSSRCGDFVYFDPPYITGHQNNGFLRYNERLFSWADQERLGKCAIALADRGVHVLVSNADYPAVIALYPGFYAHRLQRRSLIAGSASNRTGRTEVLLSSYPLL
jgi:DNA adenine methylase